MMNDIRFKHIRNNNNRPVATLAYRFTDDGASIIATLSECSENDRYEKRVGRIVSGRRLYAAMKADNMVHLNSTTATESEVVKMLLFGYAVQFPVNSFALKDLFGGLSETFKNNRTQHDLGKQAADREERIVQLFRGINEEYQRGLEMVLEAMRDASIDQINSIRVLNLQSAVSAPEEEYQSSSLAE